MTADMAEWLDEPANADVVLLESAPGGALSEAGRQAAIEASLSLLGVYFAGGDQELVERAAIGRAVEDRELDALRAGLRLRVAIAAGLRLADLVDDIAKRPTFRYELQTTEQVGSLRSALDINRWITRPRGDQELSFPVLEVQRGLGTPENVLAAYAITWLLRELRTSLGASLATAEAVEYQAVHRLQDRLIRAREIPALAACVPVALTIHTKRAAEYLISQVKRRLRRRDIANRRPYAELTNWVEACLSGQPPVAPGDIDLAVYGDRFDSKLFELWCLWALGQEFAAALHMPEPKIHLAWRGTAAAYTFGTFSGQIELYFQRGLPGVDQMHSAQWMNDDGRRLGGIPDIVVKACPTIGDTRFAVIDPKLRQRNRLPTEELYKILGYLQNFRVTPPTGAVLIYTTSTETATPNLFRDGESGTLISVALNPSAPAITTASALDVVVRTVLGLIDYQLPEAPSGGQIPAPAESEEERTEQVINDISSSLRNWGRVHSDEIASSRERIEALVGEDCWHSLDDDVQLMMATADYVGHQLPPEVDFTGPVIGMCKAVEHLLHASLIAPVLGSGPARERQTRTLGAAIDAIEVACRSQGSQLHRDIRAHLIASGIDASDVLDLVQPWRKLNTDYRVPAAHRQALRKPSWQRLYRMLLGPESLFIRTFNTLHRALSSGLRSVGLGFELRHMISHFSA
jgi:hypothetical protein